MALGLTSLARPRIVRRAIGSTLIVTDAALHDGRFCAATPSPHVEPANAARLGFRCDRRGDRRGDRRRPVTFWTLTAVRAPGHAGSVGQLIVH